MNHQQEHLSLSTITTYLDGLLSSDNETEVRDHLQCCQACADMHEISVQLRELTNRATADEPSSSLLDRATKAAVRKMQQGASTIERVLPQIADSRLTPAAAGMRGTMQTRHVLYADNDSMVSLEIEKVDQKNELYTIRGQVSVSDSTEQDLAGVEVQLLNDVGILRRCISDPLGQFRLSGLHADKYRLYVEQLAQATIVVENIEF